MTHDRDRHHATDLRVSSVEADGAHPGRGSRSAELVAPTRPLVSRLVQRKADANGVAPDADAKLAAASTSSGASLPAPLMRKFEASLGADLSGVRVHTGESSAHAAASVAAKAYTVGSDIHFGAGHFDPASATGEHLLAHEVAHTVQQAGGVARRPQFELEVSVPGDAHEVEADRAADAMTAGRHFQLASAGPGIHRKPDAPAKAPDKVEQTTFTYPGPLLPQRSEVIQNDLGDKLQAQIKACGAFVGVDPGDGVFGQIGSFAHGDVWTRPTGSATTSVQAILEKDGETWEGHWSITVTPQVMPMTKTVNRRIPAADPVGQSSFTSQTAVSSSETSGTSSQTVATTTNGAEVGATAGKEPSATAKGTTSQANAGQSGGSGAGTGGLSSSNSAQSVSTTIEMSTVVLYNIQIAGTFRPTADVKAKDPDLDTFNALATVNELVTFAENPLAGVITAGTDLATSRRMRAKLAKHETQNRAWGALATSKIQVKIPTEICTKTTKMVEDFDP